MKITLNTYNLYLNKKNNENNKPVQSKFQPVTMPVDEFVPSNRKKDVTFEGFWTLFSKNKKDTETNNEKPANNVEKETTSNVQHTDNPEKTDVDTENQELEKISEELENLGFQYHIADSEEEKDDLFNRFIKLIESPKYKPAKFSTNFNTNEGINPPLVDIINNLPDKFIPYILLETFGDGEDKIHEYLFGLDYYDDVSIFEIVVKNPEKYLDKLFDYYKYQNHMNSNHIAEDLFTQVHPTSNYYTVNQKDREDIVWDFLKTLKINKKITGEEKISISRQNDSENDRISLAEAIFLDKDTTKVFPAAQVWHISSKNAQETGKSETFDKVTEKISNYSTKRFLNIVRELRDNYEINQTLQDAINNSIVKKIGETNKKDIQELQNLLKETAIDTPEFVEYAANKSRDDMGWCDNYVLALNHIAKNSDEDYKKVLNFYKKYFKSGGNINFDKIQDYETVKLLQDAGLSAESTDISGKIFSFSTAHLRGPNGEKPFPVDAKFVNYLLGSRKKLSLKNKEDNLEKYLAECADSYDNVINTYSDLYDVINGKDFENSVSNILYIAAHNLLVRNFQGKIDADDFKKYLKSLKKNDGKTYPDKYPLDEKSLNLVKLNFAILDADKQKKVMDLIAPYGIKNFSIKRKARDAAAKAGLERQFRPYPDLKDGIGTMKQFWFLFSTPKDAPNLLEDKCFNIEVNDDKETIIDIMIGLNCEKDEDKKYKSDMLKVLEKYHNVIDWTHCDKYGNNYISKAVMAEDFQTLKFLLDNKDVDMTAYNQFGQSTIDLAKQSQNPEIRELFENVKVNSSELFELAKLGSVSGIEMLLKNKHIDVNSRDKDGYTLWLYAAKDGNIDIAEVLVNHPELDFNAVNNDGDNFAIIAAKSGNLDFIKEVFPKLKPEQLNLNYINDKSCGTVYSCLALGAITFTNIKIFKTILKCDSANPNISTDKVPPVAFQLVWRDCKGMFEALVESGKLDLSVKCGDQTLKEYINSHMFGNTVLECAIPKRRKYLKLLTVSEDNRNIEKVKQFVNKNGVLSIENIMEFLEYPNISEVIDSKLSDYGECIGHFLCNIETTPQNLMQILGAAKKILELDQNAFNCRDDFKQTAIEKALQAENEILFEYIAQNSILTSFDIEKLKNIAKNINNPKIDRIIAKLKPEGGSNDNQ